MKSIIKAPMNLFHDTKPKGQILNRLSKDIGQVDQVLFFVYRTACLNIFVFLSVITICTVFMFYSLFFLPVLLISGIFLVRFYMHASRDLSRLDGEVRSPILNSLSETLSGGITIRAFEYEHVIMKSFLDKVDEFFKVRICANGVSNWFGFVMDLLLRF